MSIPDFQTIMKPLLQSVRDGREYRVRDVIERLAIEFSLTDKERQEMLPSGTQATFDNRATWAATYLKKAGLLVSTGRGLFKISDLGQNALTENPPVINIKYLDRFPEFVQFRTQTRKSKPAPDIGNDALQDSSATPEELLESNYQSLRDALAQEILDRIAECSPAFFERLVVDLLVKMGYGGSRKDAGEAIGRSGDDGIDGVIKEDRLGLDVVHIQAKRWQGTVGRPQIQAFAGSLEGQRSRKGVFITTSQFSPDAREYVGRIEKKIILIDGPMLADLMIDFRVGVGEVATYSVCKLDLDYYEQ